MNRFKATTVKNINSSCTECFFSNQRDGGSFLKYRTRSNRSEQRALLNARTHCRLERVVETKAENKGLKLSIEMKNMPKQTFNEVLGATIFDNLVFNAIHYTDKGSVTVIVDEDQAIIRDTGIGIKEEDREKVFDRGFRAGQGGRGHYQGFGLGLAISKRAAEALGWSISLKSEVGKGTDFVIRFKPESVDEVNSNQ